MKSKLILSFILVVLIALTVSTVSATDLASDDVAISDMSDDTIAASDSEGEIVSATIDVTKNGTESDYATITNAINSASEGDTINLGENKEYDVSNNTIIINKKNITFSGKNVTIKGTGDGNGIVNVVSEGSNSTVSGIKFINTQANTQYTNANTLKGWGLFLGRGTTDVNVINCSFIDFNHGVRIQGGSNFNIIQNCYFTGAATQVTNNGNKEQGTKAIGIMGSKGTKVINNIFNGTVLDGVSVAGGSTGTYIYNNTFINNAYSIYFGGASTAGSIITNNTFNNCGHIEATYNKNGTIVNVNFQDLPVISIQKASDSCVIANNTFIARTSNVLIAAEEANTAHGYPSDIGNITVTGNKINKLNDTTILQTVVLLRIVSNSGILNPTGNIIISNNVLNGAKAATYWSNEWGNNDGEVNIPAANPVATYFEIISINNGKLTFALKDVNGNVLDGELVTYTIGNVSKNLTVDENGSASISGLPSGTVTLKYNGSAKLAAASTSIDIASLIDTKISASNLNIKVGDNGKLQVTLKDASGNPLANQKVSVIINGKPYTQTTNSKGVAYISLKYSEAATYQATLVFEGNSDYKSSIGNAKIVVSKKTTSLTAPSKTFKVKAIKKIAITLKSSGKSVAGKKITLKVNGKTYTAKTNSKGVATVKVKITKKGTFKYTASFAGDKAFKSISKKGTIKVKK